MSKRVYNKVIEQNAEYVEGVLLTDYELKCSRSKPKTERVCVDTSKCYISFGLRFVLP